jgi:hypothetical protein
MVPRSPKTVVVVALALALSACGAPDAAPAGAPREPATDRTPTRDMPESRATPPAGPCESAGPTEPIALASGGWFVSATGLGIRFDGSSHDSYDDGTTELLLSLAFWSPGQRSSAWMPSAFAEPRYEVMLGHCVRVREGSETRVVLEVAPLPSSGAQPSRPATTLPACPTTQTVPHLDDYALSADGQRRWVDVARDPGTGEWMPTPQPRMPFHHASRLSFENLTDYPALVEARERTVRFVFEQVSHQIEQVAGRHEWRAEYAARVVDACHVAPVR